MINLLVIILFILIQYVHYDSSKFVHVEISVEIWHVI